MTLRIPLRRRCGNVRGYADVAPDTGQRVVCYCDDCQAYAHFLGNEGVLDAQGGTDLFQTWPAQMVLTEGRSQVRCVRLAKGGLFRFYAGCCRTPIGNTMASSKSPFVGIAHSFMDHASSGRTRDEALGLPSGRTFGTYAHGGMPEGADRKVSGRLVLQSTRFLGRGLLRGRLKPATLFDAATGEPIATPEVIDAKQRVRLFELASRAPR